MTIINIEGLGKVEIEGETPNAQEQKAIIDALGNINKSESSVEIEKPSVEIENQYLDKIPESDVEKGLETETAIPELIDPNLAELGKPQGLEKIGGRPTFEAVGAIAGSIPGTLTGNLPVAVGGGTLGAMGTGQLYDLLQSAIVEEPTNLESQVGRAVDDFKREALLQSFFAKVPGLLTKTKGLVFGKSDKGLYDAAKRQGFPLSLSDSGNVISKGYGRVIGIFPYVGGPTKKAAIKKADFINKAADDTLNSFAPNVTLSKLGIDMTKASQSTFDDFRRISSFFYDDFFKAVDNISNTPVIPTQNYKKALLKYVKLVDGGKIKGITDPRKDSIYKYAKQTSRKLPEYINATQYRALKDAIKYYANSAQKNQPFDVKVLTGFKSSLETDLRLLTKEGYQENLLKNIYPLSKTGRQKLDPKLLADIANKLKFADKVYANGLQNSIIKEIAEKEGKKKVKGLVPVPGKKTFDAPVGSTFKRVDKNIFGAGFESPGSLNADEIGEALLRRNASPKFFSDLKSIVGQKQFDRFVRAKLQKAYDGSLVNIDKQIGGLAFDPYKFEKNLGLNTEKGREILEEMLKGSKVTLEKLDDFFLIAKNHAGLKVPDVSSFVARRAALGGTRSLLGGAVMTAGITTNPVIGVPLIYMARKTSGFLSNPKQLDDVMRVLDPNSTAAQVKTTSLKLLDALISDSQNQIEENELRLYKEFIETTPLEDIKKGIEDTLNSSEQFLNLKEEDNEEIPIIENMSMTQNIPKTPNINPNLVTTAPKANQQLSETEKALLSPSEQVIASRT